MKNESERYDVIVVGGGFAGLAAARDIAERGRSVLLLEARDRFGGRTWTDKVTLDGHELNVEIGGQYVNTDRQLYLKAELDRYGIGVRSGPTPQSYPTLLAGHHLPGPVPVPTSEMIDLERVAFQIMTDCRRLRVGIPLDQQNAQDLDIPFSEYLDRLRLPAATRGYMSYIAGACGGMRAEELSALLVLFRFADAGYSALAFMDEASSSIDGGSGLLVDAMTADSRADMRLNTPVAAISQVGDGVEVVSRDGHVFSAELAIVAAPLACWKDIQFSPSLNEHKTEASAENHASREAKIFMQVRNAPPYPHKIADIADTNGGYALSTVTDLGDDGQIMLGWCVDVPDDPSSFDYTRKGAERFLGAILPDAELVDFYAYNWVADEWNGGNGHYVAFRAGRLSKSHSHLSTSEGRIHFAGSDVAISAPGWIEGALEMGAKAGAEVLRDLDRIDRERRALRPVHEG
ncbi:flavin monoamine oxidase family protein [Catenulispora rubra]|uniref:flavin monoamine oxidase family protein n=1 Tax=Catenulispora rubra TaxID=280293 RepID=UPI001E3D45B3|nr:NAD(P)/FAD-dependent oxidoreductase [Catenulispora rubra]